jgi:hypothetical protein
MFKVIDTDHDAILGPDVDHWNRCEYPTIKEAIDYANDWLFNYGPLPIDYKIGSKFIYDDGVLGSAWIQIIETEDAVKQSSSPKKVVASVPAI